MESERHGSNHCSCCQLLVRPLVEPLGGIDMTWDDEDPCVTVTILGTSMKFPPNVSARHGPW